MNEPDRRLDPRDWACKASAILLARLLSGEPCSHGGSGTTETPGYIDALADAGASARQRSRGTPECGNGEREILSRGEISADDRTQHRRRTLPNSRGDLARFLLVSGGQCQRDQNPQRARRHCGEVAEGRSRRAVANFKAVQPIAPEVDPFDRCVGADDDSLSFWNIQNGSVVADPLRGLAPLGKK